VTAGPSSVVLTGTSGSLAGLPELLQGLGLTVDATPLVAFAPAHDLAPLDDALDHIARYSAIAVTSPRAAEVLVARATERGVSLQGSPAVWTGAASADVLKRLFPSVAVPTYATTGPASLAVTLANAMLAAGVSSPVLFPCGETHREELPVRLRASGRRVEQVICYRTVAAGLEEAGAALARADIIVATSPTVAALLARARKAETRAALVTIGPTTAEAAAAAGWTPDAIAERPTGPAVARAIQSLTLSHE
jgi:uroporphyrinogen-III synthase